MNIPSILFLPPNRIWRTYPGGKILDIMEGRDTPTDAHFPEDWIGSTTRAVNKGREEFVEEGLSSVVLNGESISLKALSKLHPDQMLGAGHVKKYGVTTQFLLKFLDSAIRLHIQCHPTVEFAQKNLNSNSGKTEAYVILSIRDEVADPYIYLGFQKDVDVEEFKRCVEEQDSAKILSYFEKVPIQPGDVFMVPGGMPHAIGEGVFMIEIMEPTDFAVRIEFERGGYVLPEESRFMGRDADFAMSMFNFNTISVDEIKEQFFCTPQLIEADGKSSEYALIDSSRTSCFRVNRLSITGPFSKKYDSFYIGIVTDGKGCIRIGNEIHNVKSGDKFFIPYQTGAVIFESEKGMQIIATLPPL